MQLELLLAGRGPGFVIVPGQRLVLVLVLVLELELVLVFVV